jgi:hypothetical protein
MLTNLNYDPEKVRTGRAYIASIAASGVAFGFLVVDVGEAPQSVAIAPKLSQLNDIRIGDTFELGYVENFEEHASRVPWRAVAIYGKIERPRSKDQVPSTTSTTNSRRTIEDQIWAFIEDGEVWNASELYYEIFDETYTHAKASDEERWRYEAIVRSLHGLHDVGFIACAKVWSAGGNSAAAVYYAKTARILGLALMGDLDGTYTGAEP